MLIQFVKHSLQPLLSTSESSVEMGSLMSRCYRRLGDWKRGLTEVPSFDDMVGILQYYRLATEHNHASYKGWHAWAFMNYEALNSLRQQTPSLQFSPSSPQQQAPHTVEVSSSPHHAYCYITYVISTPSPPLPSTPPCTPPSCSKWCPMLVLPSTASSNPLPSQSRAPCRTHCGELTIFINWHCQKVVGPTG